MPVDNYEQYKEREGDRDTERRALAKEGLRMDACYVNKGPTMMCWGEEEKHSERSNGGKEVGR